MRKALELVHVKELLREIGDSTTRMNQLIGAFRLREDEACTVDASEPVRNLLQEIKNRLDGDSDELERVLEMLDFDTYLEWLTTVPQNSPIFEKRKNNLERF